MTDNFDFEDGEISLIGVSISNTSRLLGKPLKMMPDETDEVKIRPVAILRGHKTVIPGYMTMVYPRDHLYFLTTDKRIEPILELFGKEYVKIKDIMILGGTSFALKAAKLLEREYSVCIVEKNKDICKSFHEKLDKTLVINGDPSSTDFLKEEGLDRMDAVIALTRNSETNIIACLTAENLGVNLTIANVDNTDYTHISQKIGIDTLINKKLIAANNIFRFVRKGKVEALTSIHGSNVELIQYLIQKESRLTRKKIADLKFPKNSMVAAVFRDKVTHYPDGNFQMQLHDKVIVVALPENIDWIDNLFK